MRRSSRSRALVDEVPRAGLSTVACDPSPVDRLFMEEALSLDPVALDALDPESRSWATLRMARSDGRDPAFHGQAGAQSSRAWSVSALETYLDCPFKFFAQRILRLEEEPDDEEVMDPRKQGQFVHEVFEKFFRRWAADGHHAVTPDNLADGARDCSKRVVDESLGVLSDTEAALERTRLLGSSAAAGLGEAVLRMEAERPVGVVGRLLEHKLEGEFTVETDAGPARGSLERQGGPRRSAGGRHVPADRLQARMAAQSGARAATADLRPVRRAAARRSLRKTVDARRGRVPGVQGTETRRAALFSPGDRDRVLRESQQRLADAIDAIERGDFPPHPHDVYRCETCAFTAVCRKDYVGDV